MTSSEITQLCTQIFGVLIILIRMRSYVTVEEYRAKQTMLHTEINELRVKVAVIEERAKK